MQKRTIYCGELRPRHIGRQVILNGWVQRRRDHGKLIFIDLRDRSGLVQVVFDYEQDPKMFALAESIRSEYVLAVEGEVVARDPEAYNRNLLQARLRSGSELNRFKHGQNPPFILKTALMRMKMCALSTGILTCAGQMQNLLRHRVCQITRDFLDKKVLGNRDTDFNQKHAGGAVITWCPAALIRQLLCSPPVSPAFKQLLMASGIERYFQIARCFRDEDLRADRQPSLRKLTLKCLLYPG